MFIGRKGAGLQAGAALTIAQAAHAYDADVLHSHHPGPLLYGRPGAHLLGLGHVHTEHSVEFYDRGRRRMAARAASAGVRVVAVSDAVAASRRALVGGPVEVIDNGVPVPQFMGDAEEARRRMQVPANVPVIGCVARLAKEKDHALLLRAVSALSRTVPDAHLVLVGDGPSGSGSRGWPPGLAIVSVSWVDAPMSTVSCPASTSSL